MDKGPVTEQFKQKLSALLFTNVPLQLLDSCRHHHLEPGLMGVSEHRGRMKCELKSVQTSSLFHTRRVKGVKKTRCLWAPCVWARPRTEERAEETEEKLIYLKQPVLYSYTLKERPKPAVFSEKTWKKMLLPIEIHSKCLPVPLLGSVKGRGFHCQLVSVTSTPSLVSKKLLEK